MADENNMNEAMMQQMQQNTEAITALSLMIGQLNSAFSATLTADQRKQLNLQGVQIQVEKFGDALEEENPIIRAHNRALQDQIEKLDRLSAAQKDAAAATKSAFEALTGQADRTFGKYNTAIQGFSEAMAKLAGPILGPFISAAGKVTGAFLGQYDALLKAQDGLAKVGAAQALTTDQFRDMAHQAGVTSKNLEILVKPIQSLGPGLRSLGMTAGEGAIAFGKLTAVTSEQRKEFSRMGVSQSELIQSQADYISLQTASGNQITKEMITSGRLQKQSLEYTENLQTLAALSGKDIDTIKKEQQAALSREETLIQNNLMDQEILRLKKSGRQEDLERAAQLEKEKTARDKLLSGIQNQVGDTKLTEGMAKFLATGAVTQETAALKRLGVPIEEFAARIKKGEDVTGDFLNSLSKNGDEMMKQVGPAAMINKDAREAFGYSKEMMIFMSKARGQDQNEAIKKAEEERKKTQAAGTDKAKDARAALTEIEIKAGKTLDFLTYSAAGAAISIAALGAAGAAAAIFQKNTAGKIAELGKLIGTLGRAAPAAAPIATTVASTAATAATGAAATGAAATGAAATGAAATTSAAATAATALGKLAGPLTKLSSAAPAIGTVVSVGEGVVDAYQGIKKADKDLKEGKITKEEARETKGEAIGGGTGTAVGGAGGAWAGAAAGAAIGSVVPVVGTAIGGILGAAVGGWLGSKGGKAIGEVAGGSIAKMTADADKEVDKAKKKTEEKDKKTEQKDQLSKDQVVKVSIVNPIPVPVSIVKGLEPLIKLGLPKSELPKPNFEFTPMLAGAMLGPMGMVLGKGISTLFEKQSKETRKPEATDKEDVAKLKAQREKFAKEGPATDSIQSKKSWERVLSSLDKAIAEKEKQKPIVESKPVEAKTSVAEAKPAEARPTSPKEPELPKSFTFSEMELARKDKKLYEEFVARRQEIFDQDLKKRTEALGPKASTQRLETARTISETRSNMRAKQEFAERAEKIGAAKINRDSEGTSSSPVKVEIVRAPEDKAGLQALDKLTTTVASAPKSSLETKQETKIAGQPVKAGEDLTDKQMAAIKMSLEMGNKYDPAIMEQYEKQSAKVTKKDLDLKKAADGGSFSGPKEGYPVLLHGDEDVIPRKGNVVKKPTEIETLGNLSQTALSKPKEFVQQKVSDATGFGMSGDVAGMATERILKKVAPQFEQLQKLAGNVQTAGKVEGIVNNDEGDAVQQLMDILKVIPKTGAVLDKVEGIQRIFDSDTGVMEKLWEVAKLLHPAARILGTVIDIAKPMLAEANKPKHSTQPSASEDTKKVASEKINADKEEIDIPKASKGGKFSGPETGYPVMLHGKEMVIPTNGTGEKVAELPKPTNIDIGDDDDEPLTNAELEQRERLEKLNKGFQDTDAILKKLVGTMTRLDKLEEDQFRDMEKQMDEMKNAPTTVTGAFRNVFIDLKNLVSRVKTSSGSAGSSSSSSGGSSGGSSSGASSGGSSGGSSSGGFLSSLGSMFGGSSKGTTASGGGGESGSSSETTSAQVSPADADSNVQMGQEVKIGKEIKKGGTVSWRTNNPGNVSYGELAKKYGAIGKWMKPDGDLQQRTTGIAIMPTLEAGDNLKMALWRRPKYIDKTIDQGVAQWTGTTGLGSNYARDLAKAANASMNTVIRDLSDSQIKSMVDKQKQWEGFKEGQVVSAKEGAIIDGPSTGYPIDLTAHGNEVIAPLDKSTILGQLAKEPASETVKNMMTGNAPANATDTRYIDAVLQYMQKQQEMMEMLSDKLDDVVSELEESNDTQDDLLKAARV